MCRESNKTCKQRPARTLNSASCTSSKSQAFGCGRYFQLEFRSAMLWHTCSSPSLSQPRPKGKSEIFSRVESRSFHQSCFGNLPRTNQADALGPWFTSKLEPFERYTCGHRDACHDRQSRSYLCSFTAALVVSLHKSFTDPFEKTVGLQCSS